MSKLKETLKKKEKLKNKEALKDTEGLSNKEALKDTETLSNKKEINNTDILSNKEDLKTATKNNFNQIIKNILNEMKENIEATLHPSITFERFEYLALKILNEDENLRNCDPVSFINSLMQSTNLGLEPNTIIGQAYLIPEQNQVHFQIGYRGLLELVDRSSNMKKICANEVKENDEFTLCYGTDQKLIHEPYLKGDRGNVIGYYALYKLENEVENFLYMTKEEIIEHSKKYSKNYLTGMWVSDFDAMAKKTVIKKLLKYAPMSIDIKKAIIYENTNHSVKEGA